MAAFVLAMIVQNYKPGQEVVHQGKAISICLVHLEYRSDHRLRSWCSLCLGQVAITIETDYLPYKCIDDMIQCAPVIY